MAKLLPIGRALDREQPRFSDLSNEVHLQLQSRQRREAGFPFRGEVYLQGLAGIVAAQAGQEEGREVAYLSDILEP